MSMKRQRQRTLPQWKVKRNVLVKTITATLRIVGCTSKSANGYMYWLTNITTIIFFIFATLQEAIALVSTDDAERRFECFCVLSFCAMGILKLSSMHLCKTRWLYLLQQIVTLEKQQTDKNNIASEEYESDEENAVILETYIQQYSDNFESTSVLLFKMYGLTGIIYIFSPFLEYIFLKMYIKDTQQEYPHVMPIWAPLDSINILGYACIVLIEIIAGIYSVCVHVAFDILVIGLMIFCRGQLRVLRHCSENVAGSGKLCSISHHKDARGFSRIRNCHQLHIFLIKFINELGRLLKHILGIYYLVAAFTLCSVVVRLKTGVLTTMELVSLLQYLCATVTQLFLFCYYGNTILSECSMGMGEGPGGSAYWSISPKVRRDLIILAIGMSLPLKLQAGPFHTLDLQSFSMILRAAYSYYAVLRQ